VAGIQERLNAHLNSISRAHPTQDNTYDNERVPLAQIQAEKLQMNVFCMEFHVTDGAPPRA
jgi:hypothetical protein